MSEKQDVYYQGHGLKIVYKYNEYVLFPEKMNSYFSHSETPLQAYNMLLKVKDLVNWAELDWDGWKATPENVKNEIKKVM